MARNDFPNNQYYRVADGGSDRPDLGTYKIKAGNPDREVNYAVMHMYIQGTAAAGTRCKIQFSLDPEFNYVHADSEWRDLDGLGANFLGKIRFDFNDLPVFAAGQSYLVRAVFTGYTRNGDVHWIGFKYDWPDSDVNPTAIRMDLTGFA